MGLCCVSVHIRFVISTWWYGCWGGIYEGLLFSVFYLLSFRRVVGRCSLELLGALIVAYLVPYVGRETGVYLLCSGWISLFLSR